MTSTANTIPSWVHDPNPSHLSYLVATLEVGAGRNYIGVEPPASIARRNMRIFANLLAVAEPGDRILIVYGVGHSHYFREYVRDPPDMTLVPANEHLWGEIGGTSPRTSRWAGVVCRSCPAMLDRLLGRIHDTSHGAPLLRGYLWWGLLIRTALLVALCTLLLVEGNVLAEWLLTARVPFISAEDVEELTAVSYSVLFLLLIVGSGMRWTLLRRLDATGAGAKETPIPDA